jgi:hypothetical protein
MTAIGTVAPAGADTPMRRTPSVNPNPSRQNLIDCSTSAVQIAA